MFLGILHVILMRVYRVNKCLTRNFLGDWMRMSVFLRTHVPLHIDKAKLSVDSSSRVFIILILTENKGCMRRWQNATRYRFLSHRSILGASVLLEWILLLFANILEAFELCLST